MSKIKFVRNRSVFGIASAIVAVAAIPVVLCGLWLVYQGRFAAAPSEGFQATDENCGKAFRACMSLHAKELKDSPGCIDNSL